MSLGHVVIGGHRFDIARLEMTGGEIVIHFAIPPGPEFSGPITVFGADGAGIAQGKTFVFPRRCHSTVIFRYGLRAARVDTSDEVVHVRDLPGWKITD